MPLTVGDEEIPAQQPPSALPPAQGIPLLPWKQQRQVVTPIAAASNKWTVTYQFVIEFRQVRGDAAPGVLLRRGCDARAYVLPDEARLPGMVNYP